MMSQREIIVEEPLPPEMPGPPQFFKFHNALPTHTVQNTDFPQIIFAEDTNKNEDQNSNHYFDNNDGFDHTNNEFQPQSQAQRLDEGLTSTIDMQRTHSDIVNPFSQFRGPMTPSPVRKASRRKSFDFSQSSPKSKGSRSMSRASPKSIRSRKEEEIFLDRLVSTVTAYNSYQEEKNQQPSGKAILNHLMEENQPPNTPDYVEVENEEYSDDDVSSVGMASTSGGRKETPSEESSAQNQFVHEERRKNPNDYFDPTIKQIKRKNSENAAAKIKNVDERSLKWRMREADKQSSTTSLLNRSPDRVPTREFMETGMSLMDRDCSNSMSDRENEDEDPTYAFGGSGIRKPPLALSEAFEDFGIDDRIYPREHRPGDTFDEDDPRTRSMQQFPTHDENQHSDSQPQRLNKTSDGSLVSPNGTRRLRGHDETRRKNLMSNYILNHHSQNLAQPETPLKNPRSNPRSNKYREINGNAFFSGSESTMSMQTSKWSNTDKNMPKNNDGAGANSDRRQSPQAIVEFEDS